MHGWFLHFILSDSLTLSCINIHNISSDFTPQLITIKAFVAQGDCGGRQTYIWGSCLNEYSQHDMFNLPLQSGDKWNIIFSKNSCTMLLYFQWLMQILPLSICRGKCITTANWAASLRESIFVFSWFLLKLFFFFFQRQHLKHDFLKSQEHSHI